MQSMDLNNQRCYDDATKSYGVVGTWCTCVHVPETVYYGTCTSKTRNETVHVHETISDSLSNPGFRHFCPSFLPILACILHLVSHCLDFSCITTPSAVYKPALIPCCMQFSSLLSHLAGSWRTKSSQSGGGCNSLTYYYPILSFSGCCLCFSFSYVCSLSLFLSRCLNFPLVACLRRLHAHGCLLLASCLQ